MKITAAEIQAAIKQCPTLTRFGLHTRTAHQREQNKEPYADHMAREQRRLLGERAILEVGLCADWLSCQDIGKQISWSSHSTYFLKHAVEWATKADGYNYIYVSNGAFLTSVILMDVPYCQYQATSPNARVAVKYSRKNIKLHGERGKKTFSGYEKFKPLTQAMLEKRWVELAH